MTQDDLFETVFTIDRHLKQTISVLQNPNLFNYRVYKLNRLKNIAAQQPFNSGWRFVAMRSWEPILSELDWAEFSYIDMDFFEDITGDLLAEKITYLDRSILLTTNYPPHSGGPDKNVQTLRNFSAFYQHAVNTMFLGWDWDNHFNLHISCILAASSDVYFPSHLSNDYELSNFCNQKFRLPLSAYQWSRKFLCDNIDLIIRLDRSDDVFGRFKEYGLFGHRNSVVATLAQHLPHVELSAELKDYHQLDPRGKLEEWTRYKCHWVVPTLTDVSTRIFDILISGGIPIVPDRFRGDDVFREIDERDCFFHNDSDVLEPADIVQRVLDSFDHCGVDGVLRRHRFAVDRHNLDTRISTMINTAREVLKRL